MIDGGTSQITGLILAVTLSAGLYAAHSVSRRTENPLFVLAYLFAAIGVTGTALSSGIDEYTRTAMIHGVGVMGTGITALALAVSGRSKINALQRRVEREGPVTVR